MNVFTTRDGMRLAYYDDCFAPPWKTAQPVLLLHPAMGNSQRWFHWMPALAAQYRVIRLDLRGHGASQIPGDADGFSLQHLVDDVLELLGRLDIDSLHVVGNSAGGYVSQKLAIQHPERVRTLSLYGSPPGLKHSHAPTWLPKIEQIGLRKFLADTIAERFDDNADPDHVQWFIEQAGSNDPKFIARFVSHMCTHDFMDEIDAIRCPTLIVAAGKEAIGQASAYQEMNRRIGRSELVTYDTAAHNLCDGYAERTLQDLRAFLARHS